MRSLGLDIGDRRIGIALSDPLGILATPLEVLERKGDAEAIAAIMQIVKRNQVEYIIVGMPQSMDGTMGAQAEKVASLTDKLKEQSPVPVEFRDERLTTVTAKRMMEEAGNKRPGKGKKIEYDAAAAAVILQSYLNESRPMEFPSEEE
jgi:putative Holliday junction resolvase